LSFAAQDGAIDAAGHGQRFIAYPAVGELEGDGVAELHDVGDAATELRSRLGEERRLFQRGGSGDPGHQDFGPRQCARVQRRVAVLIGNAATAQDGYKLVNGGLTLIGPPDPGVPGELESFKTMVKALEPSGATTQIDGEPTRTELGNDSNRW
jgi:hypothetical protein